MVATHMMAIRRLQLVELFRRRAEQFELVQTLQVRVTFSVSSSSPVMNVHYVKRQSWVRLHVNPNEES